MIPSRRTTSFVCLREANENSIQISTLCPPRAIFSQTESSLAE